MSSSTYKSFAIVGAAGRIGKHIFAALHEQTTTSSILVITRTSSSSADAIPPSPKVKIAKVEDYKNVEVVAAILRAHHIEVLISAANWQTEEGTCTEETALVNAARAAGVKLFVPSEFGAPTLNAPTGIFKAKDDVAKHMKEIGLPSARFYTGQFFSWIPIACGYPSTGKINLVVGTGNTPGSFTADEDVGGFVAHVLTTLPPSELNDRIFRIEGERVSYGEIAARVGLPVVRVENVPSDNEQFSQFCTMVQKMFERGYGSTGWDHVLKKDGAESAGSANALWTGHVWRKVSKEDFVKTG
ncbi:NAD(P)-binding protein [Armillaria solidipes]|uniref:NAD(P)-binding protein n=1 Tax=Armillaria solidipes TaxID=1076256 RepID=A0A2H3BKZ7_9AGAR|nr:NAD(P)-binding protein [Armillaria solidipes]